MRKQKRKFLLTMPCANCPKRVRVYDILPDCVLCAVCYAAILRDEKGMQTEAEE